MIKHLSAHGNSSALVIDRAILDLLKITHKTALQIATDGRNLIISPVGDGKREQKFKAALSKVNLKYANTLKELAK